MEIVRLCVRTDRPKKLGVRAIVCDEKGSWHMCVWALRYSDGEPQWYNEKGYIIKGKRWAVLPDGSETE